MNKKDFHRACPVCKNTKRGEILHSQKFILPDNHMLPREYDLVACSQCGFVYADTTASQEIYDKYYAEMSKYEMDYINSDTTLFIDRAARINMFVRNKNASIIDVGCGNGQLLIELQKLGFSDLTALDPSKNCIEAIRNLGIDGITSSIFDITLSKQYDCVILSGVLEHICDVGKIMQTMKLLAKPDGLLFVCVPDASRYQDYDSIAYGYFNTEHINHFDEISLINLGLLHGWSTVGMIKATITFFQEEQPVIFHVYKNVNKESVNWLGYSRKAVKDYIAITGQNKNVNNIIDKLVESREEIIVWGAGNYTNRLLATSNLSKCNISIFVDNDKNKHGANLCGIGVYAPSVILEMKKKSTIIVAVAVLHDQILRQIMSMGIDNKVIVLK